jgi:formylglycine-generating enzyme required for sulfatase activity
MSIHLEPDMVDVKSGSFRMFDERSKTTLDVKIARPFRLGKYEVTFDEYDRFAVAKGKPLPNDSKFGRGRRPVINISFVDAQDYAAWLSEKTDKRYRLPSEAEWEYAARSGGKDEIWAGTSDEKQLADYAVFDKRQTEPVGSRKSNGLGLYDMSGNVNEWVEDCWHENYTGAPADGSAWLERGGRDCRERVIRGGSWDGIPEYLRTSYRGRFLAGPRNNGVGFRLAQDLP